MDAQDRNCYALDSCLCSTTSSPQIEEDPFKCSAALAKEIANLAKKRL
jgi:hypothetical protein